MAGDCIAVYTHRGGGFEVMHEDEAWRVGLMTWLDEYSPDRITTMQCHENCDEVFVLLRGHCALLTLRDAGMEMTDLQPEKIYNVAKGVWHNHVLDERAMVLVVENRNMSLATSPYMSLSEEQRRQMGKMLAKLQWIAQPEAR